MSSEKREKKPRNAPGGVRPRLGPNVGAWSRAGELLGRAKLPPEDGGALEDYAHCSVSRGTAERGVRFTVYAFDGGYRVLVEEWNEGEDRTLWLAPAEEEEESYVGLFSGEEIGESFPYLLAALEMPAGIEVCGNEA